MGAHRVSHFGGGANLLRGVWLTTLLFSGEARCPRADTVFIRRLVLVVICVVTQTLATPSVFYGFFRGWFRDFRWPCSATQAYFCARFGEAEPFDSGSESLTILVYHRFLVVQDCKVSAKTARLKVKQIPE